MSVLVPSAYDSEAEVQNPYSRYGSDWGDYSKSTVSPPSDDNDGEKAQISGSLSTRGEVSPYAQPTTNPGIQSLSPVAQPSGVQQAGAAPPPATPYNPWDSSRNSYLQSLIDGLGSQQAPQSAGTQLAPFQSAQGVTLGPAAMAGAPTMDPAAMAQIAQLGPAAMAGGASYGSAGYSQAAQAKVYQLAQAQQAQESAFRQYQQQMADQQQRWASGQESLSAIQLREAFSRLQAQQYGLAQSARPGNTAMAQRMAAQQSGQLGAGLSAQQAMAGIQERQAAASALANIAQQGRAQDLSNSQFNAGQMNQMAGLQGQLGQSAYNNNASLATQAGIANAANQTQMGIAEGNMSGQIGMYNAGQRNALNAQQGAITQQAYMGNQDAINQRNQTLAALLQNNAQFNAGAQNSRTSQQGAIDANMNEFNAGQANNYGFNAAQMGQQNQQFNTGMQFNQRQLNAQQLQALLSQQQGAAGMAQQGNQFDRSLDWDQFKFPLELANKVQVAQAALPQPWQYAVGAGAGLINSMIQPGGFLNQQNQQQYGGQPLSQFGQQFIQGGGEGAGNGGSWSWGGAGAGAASGAAMGSTFGPWGTAIGAGVGGIWGGIKSFF